MAYSETFISQTLPLILTDHDMVAFDIGAHVGDHIKEMSSLCKMVYGFEPDPDNVKELNKLPVNNLIVVPKVVTDFVGHTKLYICETNTGGHTICEDAVPGSPWGHDLENFLDVECTTLDDYVKDLDLVSLDLIKIDVEGSEIEALHGAHDTLAKFRPSILIETHRGIDTDEIVRICKFLKYTIKDTNYNTTNKVLGDNHYWLYSANRHY